MNAKKLPEDWVCTEVGDIADIISGGTPKSGVAENFAPSGESIAWLTPADLSGYKSKYISHGARDLSQAGYDSCSAKLMPTGSILFSSRAPIGYVAVAANDISTNQGFKSFVFNADVSSEYAYYYMRSIKHLAEEMGTGTTFKEISGSSAKTLPFVIAPLAEQKIIAEKLDTLLAQVDSTKARLEQIPKILKRFRQATLNAAVTGELTQRWEHGDLSSGIDVIHLDYLNKNELYKKEPLLRKKKSSIESDIDEQYLFSLPEKWAFTSWGKVSEWITYGFTRPMPKTESGNLLLTAKDIQNFSILFNNGGFTSEEAFNELSDKDKPVVGDLLITKDGSIGRAALVKKEIPFCINQSVAVCWLRTTSMNKNYLEIVANSSFTQNFIKDKSQGMAIQHLSIIDYAKCPLPVPPLPEQHEIVRRVEQLFAYADTIEKQVNAALARVNNLTQSILAKAFRGELTAQWRAENPDLISGENSAKALLEKIKAERAASTGKKSSRKKA